MSSESGPIDPHVKSGLSIRASRFRFSDQTWIILFNSGIQALLFLACNLIPYHLVGQWLDKKDWAFYLGAIFLAWPLLEYARFRFRKIWQLAILSLAVLSIPLLFNRDYFTVLQLVSLLIMVFRTGYLRLHEKVERPNNPAMPLFVSLLVLFGLTLLSEQLKLDHQFIYIICAILLILLVLGRNQLQSLQVELERFVSQRTQPVVQIRRFNLILFGIFILILTLILVLSVLFHTERLLYGFGPAVLAFLRWFIKLILSLFDGQEAAETTPETEPEPIVSGQGGLPPAGDTPQWLLIIQEILYHAMIAAMILIAVYALYRLLRHLYRQFYSQNNPDQVEQLQSPLFEQFQQRIGQARQSWQFQTGRDSNTRIRRTYAALLNFLSTKGFTPDPGMSPQDIAQAVEKRYDCSIRTLTELYEKARYSVDSCSGEEVAQAGRLSRQARQMMKKQKGVR